MISSALRIAYKVDGEEHEIAEATIERQCENQFIEDMLDAGPGARTRCSRSRAARACRRSPSAIPNMPVYPGLDTKFIGILQEQGVWAEKCAACGKCVLGAYGAVCPITRCSKGLLSGPCGGSRDGKCEVSPDIECGWQLIYDRLKALGQLDKLLEARPAHRLVPEPRRRLQEDRAGGSADEGEVGIRSITWRQATSRWASLVLPSWALPRGARHTLSARSASRGGSCRPCRPRGCHRLDLPGTTVDPRRRT